MEMDVLPLLARTLRELGTFVNARPRDLAFVENATTGVNAVVRSLNLQSGDEVLVLDVVYPAGSCFVLRLLTPPGPN